MLLQRPDPISGGLNSCHHRYTQVINVLDHYIKEVLKYQYMISIKDIRDFIQNENYEF